MTMTRGRIILERRLWRWWSVVVCCGKARWFRGKARLEGRKSRRGAAKARWSTIKFCRGSNKVRWWSIKVRLRWWWWRSDQVWSGHEGWCWWWCIRDEVRYGDRSVNGSCCTDYVECGVFLNTYTHTHTHAHIRRSMLFVVYYILLYNNIVLI